MAQGTSGTTGRVEVGPEARAAAAALAVGVRAAVRSVDPGAEPAAFAPALERLAADGEGV